MTPLFFSKKFAKGRTLSKNVCSVLLFRKNAVLREKPRHRVRNTVSFMEEAMNFLDRNENSCETGFDARSLDCGKSFETITKRNLNKNVNKLWKDYHDEYPDGMKETKFRELIKKGYGKQKKQLTAQNNVLVNNGERNVESNTQIFFFNLFFFFELLSHTTTCITKLRWYITQLYRFVRFSLKNFEISKIKKS